MPIVKTNKDGVFVDPDTGDFVDEMGSPIDSSNVPKGISIGSPETKEQNKQAGKDFYSKSAIAERQKKSGGSHLIPTVQDIGNAVPGGLEALPSYAAAATLPFAPEIAGWQWLTTPTIGAATQGGSRALLDKIAGKSTGASPSKEALAGGIGGVLGVASSKPLSWLGSKMMASEGSAAERELMKALANKSEGGMSLGPLKISSGSKQKIGPEVSKIVEESLDKAARSPVSSMQDAANAGVDLDDIFAAFNNSLRAKGNTVNKIAGLKGVSPEQFMKAPMSASMESNIINPLTKPITDLQKGVQELQMRTEAGRTVGGGLGRALGPAELEMLKSLIGDQSIKSSKDAISKYIP